MQRYKQKVVTQLPYPIQFLNNRLTTNVFKEQNMGLAKFVDKIFKPVTVEDFCNKWLAGINKETQAQVIADLTGYSKRTVKDWGIDSAKSKAPKVVESYLGAIHTVYSLLHDYEVAFRRKL